MSQRYKEKIQEVAQTHSYKNGFNGTLGHYRLKALKNFFTSLNKTHILEIGAGEGQITEYLTTISKNITTLEPADSYFNILENKFKDEVKLYNCFFEDFKNDDKFENIILFGVLEHVEDPITFLIKIAKRLEKDGSLYLTVPNATSCHRFLGTLKGKISHIHELSEIDHQVGHFRYYDINSLKQDIESSGVFNISFHSGIMIKTLPNTEMEKLNTHELDFLYDLGIKSPELCAEIFLKMELK